MAKIGLIRESGLGDVLMALAAAHAIKIQGNDVVFMTSKSLAGLAGLCPFVDKVVYSMSGLEECDRVFFLGHAIHSIKGIHLVDAFLEAMGFQAPPENKELRLLWPKEAFCEVESFFELTLGRRQHLIERPKKRVLLHPGVGDPNRTWDKACWETLAKLLISYGFEVISIGQRCSWDPRSAAPLKVEGVIHAIDQLSLYGCGVLMEHSDLLVSCDSGPIQLAGATSIAILGIYTVVKGNDRLPYRRGKLGWNCHKIEAASCPWAPCYRHMLDDKLFELFKRDVCELPASYDKIFSTWCLNRENFSCLKMLNPQVVAVKCKKILSL